MKIGGLRLRFVAEKSATTFQTSLAEFYHLQVCYAAEFSVDQKPQSPPFYGAPVTVMGGRLFHYSTA